MTWKTIRQMPMPRHFVRHEMRNGWSTVYVNAPIGSTPERLDILAGEAHSGLVDALHKRHEQNLQAFVPKGSP